MILVTILHFFKPIFFYLADGYNRSEACIFMLLQRASEAKRSYATLLSVKSMQFGEHEQHIINHNSHQLKSLLSNSYKEANIDPATVEFVEANGSGLKVIVKPVFGRN